MTDGYQQDLVTAVVERGGEPVVEVAGEIDLRTVGSMEQAIEALAAKGGPRVVVDLANVSFLDSSGVTALVRAAQGHTLVLRAPSQVVREVLAMAGLTGIMRIEN